MTNAMQPVREERILGICRREWEMFSRVRNTGGRAACQNDGEFFRQMRACQFAAWSNDMLASYETDLKQAEAEGRNLLEEKYAWMMASTHPEEFSRIASRLPPLAPEKAGLIDAIVAIQLAWEREVDERFPHFRSGGRPLTRDADSMWVTSFETYLAGELKTYSLRTLRLFLEHMRKTRQEGGNLAMEVAANTARVYGHESLEAAESAVAAHPPRRVV